MILGFETSGPTASVALHRDGALLAEHAVHHTRTHSETVLPMAEALMRDLGLLPDMLDAVAVNKGPGSFTGVRIGICIANAMAQANGIPVVGIPSLICLYYNVCFYKGRVCTLLDARNSSVYYAQFENGSCIAPPAADAIRACLNETPAGTLFIGDGAAAYHDEIMENVPDAVFIPEAFSLIRAGAVCAIAGERLQEGYAEDNNTVNPLYLRPSQAERMFALKEQAKGRP